MFIERCFSSSPTFEPYTFTDEEGSTFVSPFAVVVMGIHQEILGAGRVIGRTMESLEGNPVIELDDPTSSTGTVEILGAECWWAPLSGNAEGIAELLASRLGEVVLPSAYLQRLKVDMN
jgi:hypothetical protein